MAPTLFRSRVPLPAIVGLSLSLLFSCCSAMNADDAGPQEGSTSLFAVFALSMLSLFVFPYTISKVVKAAAPEKESRPWEKGTKKSKTARVLSTLLDHKQSALLWASWALWLLLLLWARGAASGEVAPFDPWEILQVPRGATPADARRAYRALSLQYHPDKNPDPAAAAYFAESITKAYKALTDDVSRENYEKYGHPDGQQSSRMNIALPEWMFSRDGRAAPALLALLIGGGVLAPLMLAAAYLFRSAKHEGPGTISPETIEIFAKSKWCVKEAHSVRSISADPLVMAYEFIMLNTPATQQKPLEELRRTIVDWAPGLKDKQVFWKRRTSIVKVDMLLMAYFARLPIPTELQSDLRYVLTKSPFFLEEMLKIANIPRVYGWPFGWLAPTVGVLETLQCLSVALTPSARRPPPGGAAAAATAGGGFFLDAALLALPGIDIDTAKKLARTRKIKTLTDLLLLGGPEERKLALVEAGLVDDDEGKSSSSSKLPAPGTVAAVEAAILALPDLAIAKAKAGLGDFDSDDETDDDDDGDDVPRPGDVVTVSCRALLSRRCHTATPDAKAPRGKVLPFAPYVPTSLPVTRYERWWVVVGDANSNTCFAVKRVDLRAAENAAFEARKAGAKGLGGDAEVLAFVESRMIGKEDPGAGASAEVKAASGGSAGKKKGGGSSNALVASNSSSSLASLKPPPPARANTMGPYALPQASNANAAAAAAEHGARFEVQFEAPPRPGKYNLTLMLICDSSVGGDRAMPLRLRVANQSRAEREGKVAAQQAATRAASKKKKAALAASAAAGAAAAAAAGAAGKKKGSSSEITVASEDGGGAVVEEEATSSDDDDDDEAAAAVNSSDEDDEEDEEDGNGEWDSEESGTEASGVSSSESESEAEEEAAEEEESSDEEEEEEEEEEESSSAEEEDDSSAAATSTRPSTGATTTTAASDDDEEEEEEDGEEEEEEESSSGEEVEVEEEEEESAEEEATPSPASTKAGKPTPTTDVAVAAE